MFRLVQIPPKHREVAALHIHLESCGHCRTYPTHSCQEGQRLLFAAAISADHDKPLRSPAKGRVSALR